MDEFKKDVPIRVPEGSDLMRNLDKMFDRGFEKIGKDFGHGTEYYAESEAETSSQNAVDIRKNNPKAITASSDATGFSMIWREESFYKKNAVDASEVVVLAEKDRFDATTKQWFTELEDVIVAFAQMNVLPGDQFLKTHRNEVHALTKKFGAEKIYGSKGLFQFLNTYHRAKNLCPELSKVTEKDFDFEKFSLKHLKLSVGNSRGKEDGKKDRYARAVWRKKVEDVPAVEPVKAAPVIPTVPKSPDVVTPETVPARPYPKPYSAEFFARYKIGDDGQEAWLNYKPIIDPWLGQENFDMLKDPSFWDNLPKTELERNGKITELFVAPDGKLFMLFNGLEALVLDYKTFFNDTENPDSVKYQALYFYACVRMAEYFQRANNIAAIDYHTRILEDCENLAKVKDYSDAVRKQLLISVKYLLENDLGVKADKDKKAELEKKYRSLSN